MEIVREKREEPPFGVASLLLPQVIVAMQN
jgi:hypothetical protein